MQRKIHPAAAAWLLRCTSTQAIVIIGAVVGLVAGAIFLAITAVNKPPTL